MKKLATCLLTALSISAMASGAHAACFSGKVVSLVKAHGDYRIGFKVKGDDTTWYKTNYNLNYVSGRAIYQILLTSLLTGVVIDADGPCDKVENVSIRYN